MRGEAETVAQRGRQQAGSCGRSDDRERRERQGDRGRAGSLADDHIDAKVLHREVEHFLGRARQAVDLVNKEDVAFLQARQDSGQVARMLDGGAGGQTQRRPHLGGDDHGERRLAQTGRACEQDMIGGGRTHAGGVEDQLELASHDALTHELGELLGS